MSLNINPFTAPACNISGLKSAHTHTLLQTVYFDGPIPNLPPVYALGWESFHVLTRRGKGRNDLVFATFSDGAASTAVKGLKVEFST